MDQFTITELTAKVADLQARLDQAERLTEQHIALRAQRLLASMGVPFDCLPIADVGAVAGDSPKARAMARIEQNLTKLQVRDSV